MDGERGRPLYIVHPPSIRTDQDGLGSRDSSVSQASGSSFEVSSPINRSQIRQRELLSANYLTVDTNLPPAQHSISSGSNSPSTRSPGHSPHSGLSATSPNRLMTSLSNHLSSSSRRSVYDDASERQELSFLNQIADDEELNDLKADIKHALKGDNNTAGGTWLAPPSATDVNSASSKNASKTSLVDDGAIELDSLKPYPTTTYTNRSKESLAIPASPNPSTVGDVFHQFTNKLKNVKNIDKNRFGYANTDQPSKTSLPEITIGDNFSTNTNANPFYHPDDIDGEDDDDEEDQMFTPQQIPVQLKLYGYSLGYFAPYNSFRNSIATQLVKSWPNHTMRLILLLHTALLAYRQWNPRVTHGYVQFGTTWVDWIIFTLNCIYTLEIAAKCIAWGVWDDSQLFHAMERDYRSIKDILGVDKIKHFIFGDTRPDSARLDHEFKHSITFKEPSGLEVPVHRAFLRSSWNRLDLISTLCFWVNLFLSIGRTNVTQHVPLFRALECLRILRLVNITDRISLLLRSIKNGAPQLTDVALFILYFWTLFGIIGVQSFKSSFRRWCVWVNPDDPTDTYQTTQHCGGYYVENSDGSLSRKPYLTSNGMPADRSKGFLCPVNSVCQTLENPYGNTYSFDNIVNSMQLAFVVMSANTFSDTMYDTMDTDAMASSIYFICGIFMLFLWIVNLLVAVISSSFKATVEAESDSPKNDNSGVVHLDWEFPPNILASIYQRIGFIFNVLIISSISLMCVRDLESTDDELLAEYKGQAVISLILLCEIIVRFFCYRPTYRKFFKLRRNQLDLVLAIINAIISVPYIHTHLGRGYDWFRFFIVARFYRCVLMFTYVRNLWAQVWRSIRTIINLSLFYFILLFLTSIIFARYFEGFADLDYIEDNQFPLHTLPNTFISLYVITTTENWSSIMYGMQEIAPNKSSAFFGGVLFMMWFLLSNSLVLNIFIAIIGNSLEVSEKLKRKEQVRKFILVDFPKKLRSLAEGTVISDIRTRIFGADDEQRHREIEKLLLNGAAVQEFLREELSEENTSNDLNRDQAENVFSTPPRTSLLRSLWAKLHLRRKQVKQTGYIKRMIGYLFWNSPDRQNPFFVNTNRKFTGDDNYVSLAEKFHIETERTVQERRRFLKENPGFNTSLYILRPNQPLRKFCQRLVAPSVGKRYDGVEPNKYANVAFLAFVGASTISLVSIACYTTPIYRKAYNMDANLSNWTFDVELAFGILFLAEFLIKIIADGVMFTPNAYFQNSWNFIDFVVLTSIWINIIALLKNDDQLSRIVRGLKALRALRLLTISNTSKDIFHKVMLAGVWKIIRAALLSFTLLFPFAAWGLNLFSGRLGYCNNSDSTYAQCTNEFSSEVYKWDLLMPAAYLQPQLELNRFASSLLTLFEVLSLEGWTDLLENIMNSTGKGTPQSNNASPGDAAFLVIFIFVGIVFVLTLFISVIITNYAVLSGGAFLTLKQRSWNEVHKLLSQTKPRRRPKKENLNTFRVFCFKFGVERNKYVTTSIHCVLWIHVLAILLEAYPSNEKLNNFRYTIYILSSTIFTLHILMRLVAIGPTKFFKIRWNVYELFVFLGAFGTSCASFFVSRNTVFANINKLFLLGIFTVLIHMSNRLSHLLKIASASLPSMLSLIFTWAILFLVYAVALNQIFGLTKLGPNTSGNQNVRTVTKALILLFKNSFGESWNYVMKDFAIESPYCVTNGDLISTDCGNMQYSYLIFISWNIISMYIFVNMFVSLIFENFSYVYTDDFGSLTLTREEIRTFKTTWAQFDPDGDGYISLERLPQFLRSLEGYFSFKVYEGKWSIPELSRDFISKRDTSKNPYDVEVDVRGLSRRLQNLDVQKARERKLAYERFIEEAKFNMERYDEPGVTFERMIVQIPLYARFDENNCLTLTEFLDRLVVSRKLNERLQYRRRLASLETFVCRWNYLHKNRTDPGLILPRVTSNASTSHVNRNPFSDPVEINKPPSIVVDPFVTPRSSFGSGPSRDLYWSPPSNDVGSKTGDELMDELSDIAGGLEHSQWRNELKTVGDDINAVLAGNMSQESGVGSGEEVEENYSFDDDDEDKPDKDARKII